MDIRLNISRHKLPNCVVYTAYFIPFDNLASIKTYIIIRNNNNIRPTCAVIVYTYGVWAPPRQGALTSCITIIATMSCRRDKSIHARRVRFVLPSVDVNILIFLKKKKNDVFIFKFKFKFIIHHDRESYSTPHCGTYTACSSTQRVNEFIFHRSVPLIGFPRLIGKVRLY